MEWLNERLDISLKIQFDVSRYYSFLLEYPHFSKITDSWLRLKS